MKDACPALYNGESLLCVETLQPAKYSANPYQERHSKQRNFGY